MRLSALATSRCLLALGVLFARAQAKRIDTHHHAIPQVYRDAIEKYGEESGFPTPEWSLEATLKSMDQVGTDQGTFLLKKSVVYDRFLTSMEAILSVTTPGPPIAGTGQEGRQLAREDRKSVV